MLTASGVRFRFFTGCQSAASSGHSVATSLNPLRAFLPEQYGQRARQSSKERPVLLAGASTHLNPQSGHIQWIGLTERQTQSCGPWPPLAS